MVVLFERVRKTLFPRFDVDEDDDEVCCEDLPALDELSDASSDSEASAASSRQHQTKQNEDVAVFRSLVEKMSVKSLLFLLQSHVRELHQIPEVQLQALLKNNPSNGGGKKAKKTKLVKKCRFAEIMGGQQIRVHTREIPLLAESLSEEEKAELWWSKDEQKRMRNDAKRIVRIYRRKRFDYASSVEMLAESFEEDDADDLLVEHHMKRLTRETSARGFETHIVDCLGQCRTDAVQAVLREQAKMTAAIQFGTLLPAEVADLQERMRRCYQVASLPCKTLAMRMGECDHIEALKASLCSWDAKSRWEA